MSIMYSKEEIIRKGWIRNQSGQKNAMLN